MGEDMPQSAYLTALRLSLRAASRSEFSILAKDDFSESADNADFRGILAGILFSRHFILTYQIVLLVLLLFFAARRWIPRYLSWQMKQAREPRCSDEDLATHRSSSSSTLQGEVSSPLGPLGRHDIKTGERSPLLGYHEGQHHPGLISRLKRRIKAWLIDQPRPMPVINKTLPSNGSTVMILAFLGLQVFYVFYKMPLSIPMLFVFADRTALVFVANLPLLYLLAAKNQPIKVLTGYSYESLNIIHRRLGEVLCLLALLHSLGMIGVWYTVLRPTGFTLARFILSKIILLGLGALFSYETLYLTSLGSFRQRWYELFLGLHVFLQAAALILVWFHHHGSRPYVAAALAIFLLDRCLYRITLKINFTKASLEVTEDNETILVHATIPLRKQNDLMAFISQDTTRGWKATQHVFLTVPSLARKHHIQAHPFTIASKVPADTETEAKFGLIIRAQDGFSKDLVHHGKSHDSTIIRLDGPYGSQNAVEMLQDSGRAVLIAGGSGVAVIWPLIWSVLESRRLSDPEYAARTPLLKPILFIWVVRQKSHVSWIGREDLRLLEEAGVEIVIFPPTEEYGHPDLDSCVVPWLEKHDGFAARSPYLGLVSSGPDGMNRSVRNLAASLIVAGHNVKVEIEKFGW